MRLSIHIVRVLGLLGMALALGACSSRAGKLAHIKKRGTLVVLTRNAPTMYYIGRDGRPEGPEYQLVEAFATSIGVTPKFVLKDSVEDLLHALSRGQGDMVAAGMTKTPRRSRTFGFGPSYQDVTQQVVCRRNGPQPESPADLSSVRLDVVADSSYVMRLKALKRAHPDLTWHEDAHEGSEQLLRRVWKGTLDCTVADSNIVAINRRYFPNLVVAFNLSQSQPLAWLVPKGSHALTRAMTTWLHAYRKKGRLKALMTRYYGVLNVFDYVDARTYIHKIETVYPAYKPLFVKAAKKYDLPPLVLAAQAYQESHWNPHATSDTGARGMMMLTQNTAQSLGVHNRLDPASSIRGGAKYLARMEQHLSDSIIPSQRIWFALAAYDVGLAHLRDARKLAKRLGKNPDRWSDMRQVLPLLSKHRYYHTLKHGYARGLEPVRYIRRVRNYADILRHRTQHLARAQPAATR